MVLLAEVFKNLSRYKSNTIWK